MFEDGIGVGAFRLEGGGGMERWHLETFEVAIISLKEVQDDALPIPVFSP